MHRRPSVTKEEPPLPPRAMGIVLGLWMAAMLALAFFIVPALFGSCAPPGTTGGLGP